MNGASGGGTSRPGESGKGEHLADWADERPGLYAPARTNLRKVFPDHWSFLLGGICLWGFLVLAGACRVRGGQPPPEADAEGASPTDRRGH
ncbi:hypothetical protein [Streptomyces sp. NPDC060002]|uniref:hypothetical protein n=1 Tax=Streptomyces sp. NPDC060002 TaxID=3347033 RepID=UPI0036BB500B